MEQGLCFVQIGGVEPLPGVVAFIRARGLHDRRHYFGATTDDFVYPDWVRDILDLLITQIVKF